MTSIDVVRKGVDKAYGIRKIMEELNCKKNDILFLGDKLEKDGNDYPVKRIGVECLAVKNIAETKQILKQIIGYSKREEHS